jgi:hypothetical protein
VIWIICKKIHGYHQQPRTLRNCDGLVVGGKIAEDLALVCEDCHTQRRVDGHITASQTTQLHLSAIQPVLRIPDILVRI